MTTLNLSFHLQNPEKLKEGYNININEGTHGHKFVCFLELRVKSLEAFVLFIKRP